MIHVVHTRQVRAVTEKFYGRVARLYLFEVDDPDDARAVGATTLRDAASQLERAPGETTWGLVLSRLAPEDVARFDRRLARLLDDFRKSDVAGGAPYRLAVAGWSVEGGEKKPDA